MIAILDTSPICFLVLIGEIEILPQLFQEVVTTPGVLQELNHVKAPERVRAWARQPPEWLAIREPDPATLVPLDFLDRGEREAIALALTQKPSVVVLDDRLARQEAQRRNLDVTGLLGLLGQAAGLGLIDLPTALERLQRTHFHASPALIRALLQGHPGK